MIHNKKPNPNKIRIYSILQSRVYLFIRDS